MGLIKYNNNLLIAGCDEAGRGCLAGPVYAAAVILPKDFHSPTLNDSKKLSGKKRNQLRKLIENHAISWAVTSVSELEIDRINILQAALQAFNKAILMLQPKPTQALIDGNTFKPLPGYKLTPIINGDATYQSIAAASILAKTHRDEYMQAIHLHYPMYHWNQNKGYPTKSHRSAIKKNGTTPYHRTTFKLL